MSDGAHQKNEMTKGKSISSEVIELLDSDQSDSIYNVPSGLQFSRNKCSGTSILIANVSTSIPNFSFNVDSSDDEMDRQLQSLHRQKVTAFKTTLIRKKQQKKHQFSKRHYRDFHTATTAIASIYEDNVITSETATNSTHNSREKINITMPLLRGSSKDHAICLLSDDENTSTEPICAIRRLKKKCMKSVSKSSAKDVKPQLTSFESSCEPDSHTVQSNSNVLEKEHNTIINAHKVASHKLKRQRETHMDVNKELSAIRNQRRLCRVASLDQKLKQQQSSEEDDSNEKYVMHNVSHLDRIDFDENSLPVRQFTVHTHIDDSILYDFKVSIKPSKVSKAAGLGAFLTFRGARVLNPERKQYNDEKMKDRTPIDPGTLETLEAKFQHGSEALVTLTGKHLHGHNNSVFRNQTELPLRALMNNRCVKLSLSGENLHYDFDEEEPLGLSCCPKTFGHFGVNVEADYLPDDSIPFCTSRLGSCALLELGRYGPARKEDRKRKTDFDLKCFLFDNEPSGWCYGLHSSDEIIDKIIDITDDSTGVLHADAKKLAAVYVNEVGHNPSLVQNVKIGDAGGSVQYHIDLPLPLQKGEEVELLCNYQSHYEPTRERKGYGLANLRGERKSDYDMCSRLNRNFVERQAIQNVVEGLLPLEIYYNLEFIMSNILPSIDDALKGIFQDECENLELPYTTPRQLLARRRLHWLAPIYERRVKSMENVGFSGKDTILDAPSKDAVNEMRLQCQLWTSRLRWPPLLEKPQRPIKHKTMKMINDLETVEEVLFRVSSAFPLPMDVNIWCPIARNLILQLCTTCFDMFLRLEQPINPDLLWKSFLNCAISTAGFISEAIENGTYDGLIFGTGGEGVWHVKASAQNLALLSIGTSLSNSTNLKGAVSSLLDAQAYLDIVTLNVVEKSRNFTNIKRRCDDQVVIVSMSLGDSSHESLPRRLELVRSQKFKLDKFWYLTWQVFFPLYTLFTNIINEATFPLQLSMNENKLLKEICRELQISEDQARSALEAGIRNDITQLKLSFRSHSCCDMTQKSKSRQEPDHISKQKIYSDSKISLLHKSDPNCKGDTGRLSSKTLFFDIIWFSLEKMGWTMTVGTRPTDYTFFPPGVTRGRKSGFKPRKDFFDSYRQVLSFLENDSEWRGKDQVKHMLSVYNQCKHLVNDEKCGDPEKAMVKINQYKKEFVI